MPVSAAKPFFSAIDQPLAVRASVAIGFVLGADQDDLVDVVDVILQRRHEIRVRRLAAVLAARLVRAVDGERDHDRDERRNRKTDQSLLVHAASPIAARRRCDCATMRTRARQT